jgi:hypothetical protein
MVKYAIGAAAMAIVFASAAGGRPDLAGDPGHPFDASDLAQTATSVNLAIKLAMGPTSAAHKPGGKLEQSAGSSSACESPADSCPRLPRGKKHRHWRRSRY